MNSILQTAEQGILSQLKEPRLRPTINRLVEAGKKIMYSADTRDMLIDQLKQEGDEAEKIGGGIAKVIGLVFNASKRTAPMQALIPASVVLLCEGLQFLEDAGAVKVDLPFFEECMQATTSNVLQLLGITPEKLQEMVNARRGAAPGAPPAAMPAGIVNSAIGGA